VKVNATQSFQMSKTTHLMTQHHMPEDVNLHKHKHEYCDIRMNF